MAKTALSKILNPELARLGFVIMLIKSIRRLTMSNKTKQSGIQKITVENMTLETARENLRDWLHSAAIFGSRGFIRWAKEYDDLCQRAYQLLGDEEYTAIYKQFEKEVLGR
jgi:hypothetical protein